MCSKYNETNTWEIEWLDELSTEVDKCAYRREYPNIRA